MFSSSFFFRAFVIRKISYTLKEEKIYKITSDDNQLQIKERLYAYVCMSEISLIILREEHNKVVNTFKTLCLFFLIIGRKAEKRKQQEALQKVECGNGAEFIFL